MEKQIISDFTTLGLVKKKHSHFCFVQNSSTRLYLYYGVQCLQCVVLWRGLCEQEGRYLKQRSSGHLKGSCSSSFQQGFGPSAVVVWNTERWKETSTKGLTSTCEAQTTRRALERAIQTDEGQLFFSLSFSSRSRVLKNTEMPLEFDIRIKKNSHFLL